jgi:hypothetical protein
MKWSITWCRRWTNSNKSLILWKCKNDHWKDDLSIWSSKDEEPFYSILCDVRFMSKVWKLKFIEQVSQMEEKAFKHYLNIYSAYFSVFIKLFQNNRKELFYEKEWPRWLAEMKNSLFNYWVKYDEILFTHTSSFCSHFKKNSNVNKIVLLWTKIQPMIPI